MILRIWRTKFDPARAGELEQFARDVSEPMFKLQPGCLGVIFARDEAEIAVFSFWESRSAIDALEGSETYLATVRRLDATGLLAGESHVSLHPAFGGYVDLGRLGASLSGRR